MPRSTRCLVQCARALERDAYLRDQLGREQIADWIMVNEPTVRAPVSRILGKVHLAGRI